MMLDVSYFSDKCGCEPSIQLKDKTISMLDDAFIYLRSKTGVYIDCYGKTILYPEHQKIVIDYLRDNNNEEFVKFIRFLLTASKSHEVVIFDGD
ncbi:hypothetical protein ACBQ92_16270 [Escherichia fergusonii]|uniref:hypothetical protein n=1 Tax=Escherichia fergusonii TaxID=564 RepID=UPI001F5BBE86|nr:hypothetical protein [Escherichia fergusonii]MCZ5215761.1 hypothetical protein [Escherichia fergusonii]